MRISCMNNSPMVKPLRFPCYVIGLMSGTSADGVDAAILYTDGKNIIEVGPTTSISYSDELRDQILGLMRGEGDLKVIQDALTQVHIDAVLRLVEQHKEPISLVGFHGQTIKHAPERRITQQIGNPKMIVQKTGIPVVADFRSNDLRFGGQGAPLVPLYHLAITQKMPKPCMVVNIGGVSNVTWLGPNNDMLAFDCGPGNALMDDWYYRHTKQRYDEQGRISARGRMDERRVREFLNDPFFKLPAPKSLDRNHFSLEMVEGLELEDGMATLAAMTARGIIKTFEILPEIPMELLITGGGRHNLTLMKMMESYGEFAVKGKKETKPFTVIPVEDIGLDGDMLEAQAFAYLAARSVQGMALTFPTTTGVNRPVTGGVFYLA